MTKREFFIEGINHPYNQFEGFCIEACRPYFTKYAMCLIMDIVDFITYDKTNDIYIIQEEAHEDPKFSFTVNPIDVYHYGTKVEVLYSLPLRFGMKQQMSKEEILSLDKYLNLGIEMFYQKLKVKFNNYKLTVNDVSYAIYDSGAFASYDFTTSPFNSKSRIEGVAKHQLVTILSHAYFDLTGCDSNSYMGHFHSDIIGILYEQYYTEEDKQFISQIIDEFYDKNWDWNLIK